MTEFTTKTGPRIIAITNQKGGVGKTTTVINLGAALAERGIKVLLIDLDPQGNASTAMGVETSQRSSTTLDLLLGKAELLSIIQTSKNPNLAIVPASKDLSFAEVELIKRRNRSELLRQALQKCQETRRSYQFILIDCPPSLNFITINALVASHAVLVPLQSEFYALEGLSQLLVTVREVRAAGNPNLRIEGIVLTMFDRRNNLSLQVEEDARDNLGELVFKTVIPRNVRISEAPSFAKSVLEHDPTSKGAIAYRALAAEVIAQNQKYLATKE
ncbi:MAG: ParA family protein [Aestuariivita sp.]|nr:ParA family protein [Aestuariivita sp.]MCY4347373.1 ParA family protein [Aestuariivita sp.]